MNSKVRRIFSSILVLAFALTCLPRQSLALAPPSGFEKKALQFPPIARRSPDGTSSIFQQERTQTIARVKIAGRFLDFFEKTDKEEGSNIAGRFGKGYFDEGIIAAKHLDGEEASVLWTRLYDAMERKVKDSFSGENPEPIRQLGFALLKAGYKAQGESLLARYTAIAVEDGSLKTESGGPHLLHFLSRLVKDGELGLAEAVYEAVMKRAKKIKGIHAGDEFCDVASCLSEASSVCKDTNPSFSGRLHAAASSLYDSAFNTVKSFDDDTRGWKLKRVFWTLKEDDNFWQKAFEFLKGLPDTELKLEIYEIASKRLTPDMPLAELDAFIEGWDMTLQDVASKKAAGCFIESRHHIIPSLWGEDTTRRLSNEWISERMRAVERRFGIEQSRNVILREFAVKNGYAPSEAAGALSDKDIIKKIEKKFGSSLKRFKTLIEKVLSEGAKERIYLLRRLLEVIPHDAPQGYLREYLSLVNSAIEEFAGGAGVAIPEKVELEAGDYQESHLKQSHKARMAEALLKNNDPIAKERGRRLLSALSANGTPRFNIHSCVKPADEAIVKDDRRESDTTAFIPSLFKARKLFDATENDPAGLTWYLREAEKIVGTLSIDYDNEEFEYAEEKLFALMRMAALYARSGMAEQAEGLFQKIQIGFSRAKKTAERRLEEFRRVPEAERETGSGYEENLEENIKLCKFWIRDLESRQRAMLARLEYPTDKEGALKIIGEVIASFETDVQLRRDRFSPVSIIRAASALEEEPGLEAHAIRMYGLAIDKLALLRGNKDLFDKGISMLVETVDEGKLPDAKKDLLLSEAVKKLIPPKGRRSWLEMANSVPGLVGLSDIVFKKNKPYPLTEEELLKVFVDIAEETHFEGSDFERAAKLKGLSVLFDRVLTLNPEIAVHENFDELLPLSKEPSYLDGLALLHRMKWRAYVSSQKRGFTREAIKRGDIDSEAALPEVISQVEAAFKKEDESSLASALALLDEIIEKDIQGSSQEEEGEAQEEPSLEGLLSRKSFKALYQLAEPYLKSPAKPDALQERMLDTLLRGRSKYVAIAKCPLYRALLVDSQVHVSIKRRAFQGLIQAGKVSAYVEGYFNDEVLTADKKLRYAWFERRFYTWIRELLSLNDGELLPDFLLAYLFQDSTEEKKFFEEDFFEDCREMKQDKRWVPDLFDEADILLAYWVNRPWNWGDEDEAFVLWISAVRNWYAAGVNSWDAINRLLESRERFSFGSDDAGNFSGPEAIFGKQSFDVKEKRRLHEALDAVIGNFNRRMQKIKEKKVEVPAVFEKSPPLIRYALIAYFKQLLFGEREAILSDFKTEGLSEEEALRRFFEVTGNEKLGQFLSLRRDLIPERFRKELERFQEDAEPSSFEEVKGTIEKELGASVDTFFRDIGEEPLKVGTIGEVFRVELKDGTEAIIKVITPSKKEAIQRNLERIKVVAEDIDRNKWRFEQQVDAMGLFREFERTMNEELDLRIEYQNAMRIKEGLPQGVSIPGFYDALVTESVLVQTFARGRNPLEVQPGLRKQVVIKLGQLLFKQIFFQGAYHDDLHPGNIRVDDEGNITLLDFGRIGRLTDEDRGHVVALMRAVRLKQTQGILDVLERIGTKKPGYDQEGIKVSIVNMIGSGHSTPQLMNSAFFECGSHGLEIKPAFLQLLKGILTFEGTAHMLDPQYDLEASIASYLSSGEGTPSLADLFSLREPTHSP